MTLITFIDAQTAGISGDMLLGALIDAGAELASIQGVLDLIPHHFPRCKSIMLNATKVKEHGFRACSVEFTIAEEPYETGALELVQAADAIANSSKLSKDAISFAKNSISILTEVESTLHGAEISNVHLHEAGSTDTLADIFGTAAACESLKVFDGRVCSCPVAVGGGSVSFSHGTVSVPAPAVLEVARRYHVPILGGPANDELATPTGISMLASLAGAFLERSPLMIPEKVGYGAGKKKLASIPNLLRVVIGQEEGRKSGSDVVEVLETNLDDVSGEIVGGTLQRILKSGAKDAWVTSAQFKKNRPGFVLHAICYPHDLQKITEIIMTETGTLGVRHQEWKRFILEREVVTIQVPFADRMFSVRVKIARDKSGELRRLKPEFEDLDSIARTLSIPLREVSARVLQEVRKTLHTSVADN
ncbi:MAG: nickel pincer cofactor biosynthesis protein LarC [Candidatus Bathyarchaeia archaeon]